VDLFDQIPAVIGGMEAPGDLGELLEILVQDERPNIQAFLKDFILSEGPNYLYSTSTEERKAYGKKHKIKIPAQYQALARVRSRVKKYMKNFKEA
jgi:hypothetical protein